MVREDLSGDNDPESIVSLLYYKSPGIMELSKEIQVILGDNSNHEEYIEEALTEAPDISKQILINRKYKEVKIISINESGIEYCTYHINVADRFLITISTTTEGDFTNEIEVLLNNFTYGMMGKQK